jgi:hypothetical protein
MSAPKQLAITFDRLEPVVNDRLKERVAEVYGEQTETKVPTREDKFVNAKDSKEIGKNKTTIARRR